MYYITYQPQPTHHVIVSTPHIQGCNGPELRCSIGQQSIQNYVVAQGQHWPANFSCTYAAITYDDLPQSLMGTIGDSDKCWNLGQPASMMFAEGTAQTTREQLSAWSGSMLSLLRDTCSVENYVRVPKCSASVLRDLQLRFEFFQRINHQHILEHCMVQLHLKSEKFCSAITD